MVTKRCERCNGKCFIELGIGLARRQCPECRGIGSVPDKTINDIVTEGYKDVDVTFRSGSGPDFEPGTPIYSDDMVNNEDGSTTFKFVLPSQRDSKRDSKPIRSDKGKAAGDRQRKGQKTETKVRKGT